MKLTSTFTVVYCPVHGCDLESPFQGSKDLLKHLEEVHDIKITEPSGVEPFLDQYLDKYSGTLRSGMILGSSEDLEDVKIRQALHLKMLNGLLETQQIERNTIYKRPRMCLFCSVQSQNLSELFSHMFQEHHFNIGLLDNLIFVETFLNELETMTKFKKQCIFCMEIFRSGTCLRKHLKSKNHFKINGKDERWDQFYLVNYVNLVKSSRNTIANEENDIEEDGGVDEWEDLKDEIDLKTQCLFCNDITVDPERCFVHMKTEHGFDLKGTQREHKLSFYDTMKLVNYLRNCQRLGESPFGSSDSEEDTMEQFIMLRIPEMRLWNKPQFYFPVYEEDPLLTAIEDDDDESEELIKDFNKL